MAHLKHNQRDFLARLHKRTEIIMLKLKAANPLMNKKTMQLSVKECQLLFCCTVEGVKIPNLSKQHLWYSSICTYRGGSA